MHQLACLRHRVGPMCLYRLYILSSAIIGGNGQCLMRISSHECLSCFCVPLSRAYARSVSPVIKSQRYSTQPLMSTRSSHCFVVWDGKESRFVWLERLLLHNWTPSTLYSTDWIVVNIIKRYSCESLLSVYATTIYNLYNPELIRTCLNVLCTINGTPWRLAMIATFQVKCRVS